MEQKFKLDDRVMTKLEPFNIFTVTKITYDGKNIRYSGVETVYFWTQDELELAPIKKELTKKDIQDAWVKAFGDSALINCDLITNELGLWK